MTTALKLPVLPLDRVGRVTVSFGAVPLGPTAASGTPSPVSAASQADVSGEAFPSAISRTFRSSVGAVAAEALPPTPTAARPAVARTAARHAPSHLVSQCRRPATEPSIELPPSTMSLYRGVTLFMNALLNVARDNAQSGLHHK